MSLHKTKGLIKGIQKHTICRNRYPFKAITLRAGFQKTNIPWEQHKLQCNEALSYQLHYWNRGTSNAFEWITISYSETDFDPSIYADRSCSRYHAP